MLACIAPDLTSTNHTINTLRYSDRLKEKTAMAKNSNIQIKANANPLLNSTSDESNLNFKNALVDISSNESNNKNQKSNSKDVNLGKKSKNAPVKNVTYEEIVY